MDYRLWAVLVNAPPTRYPARMENLTIETLRALARAQGLEVADEDLTAVLPLVRAGRAMTESLAAIPLGDTEPTSQYRIL